MAPWHSTGRPRTSCKQRLHPNSKCPPGNGRTWCFLLGHVIGKQASKRHVSDGPGRYPCPAAQLRAQETLAAKTASPHESKGRALLKGPAACMHLGAQNAMASRRAILKTPRFITFWCFLVTRWTSCGASEAAAHHLGSHSSGDLQQHDGGSPRGCCSHELLTSFHH